ncbi:Cullin repeat-like-containing domain superfamily [Arabidopsis thaliana x Arabidopsis arenosa]|uniref:Exocyst subunit Exo70 family protein n=1 Tax=Arabidopsis thaliana x Arabidopsis arenosa TaxID=1240361 RepID=A0A8T1ZJ60_9BRAS|nr:Cullin repeat-like-containing domain superfamily [Arabidopsis thaliana x Arabidopsis arenosa]
MEKNDKDPDHDDKSKGDEKGDVVSDAHPSDAHHQDGEEAPEIRQTLESLSEELDQFLPTLSLHMEEHKDSTEEKGDGYFQIPQFVGKFLDLFEEKLSKYDSGEPKTVWYQDPEERAMAFLEDEFRIILEESVTKESVVVTDDSNSQRRSTADQQDHQNDVVVSQDHDQMLVPECEMSWDTLEREIPIWNKTFKDCSSLFFPGELKLAERIFPGDEGNLFCIVTHGLAIQFLGFAEAVAMTRRSTEKLFKILDIYETLRDSFPAMEELFPEELRSELRNEVTSARSRLGETAIHIFCDLEHSIKSDSSKTPVPGGAVHPLTRYTMNYLKYSCEYKDTLEQVFKSHSKMEREEEEPVESGNSAFASQLMRIMELLDGTWRQSQNRHEGLMHNGKIVKPNLKERFKSFNATFDEIHKTQTTWVVNDEQLQSELRVSITAVMIPAYRAFMARFGQYLDPGRQTEKYVKYQPEDIEDLIDQLFEGNTSSSSTATARRRT